MVDTSESSWHLKRLPFGGKCVACYGTIEKRAMGWHARNPSRVMCTSCRPAENSSSTQSAAQSDTAHENPVGGSSALRVHSGRRDRKWRQGAAGEYLMDVHLHENLSNGEIILADRRVPNSSSNIDHVVIASSGVWIIDSKKWRGKVEYVSSSGSNWRLLVNGQDHTDEVDKIFAQVIPVAQVLEDRSTPINPALCFIDADWRDSIILRDLFKRPYKHDRVVISPPRLLVKVIKKPGPLDNAAVQRIGEILDRRLPPM